VLAVLEVRPQLLARRYLTLVAVVVDCFTLVELRVLAA
jgi:hypothetical protein